MNKAIFALIDTDVTKAYIPGVAEQCSWIIDLEGVGVLDLPALGQSLQPLVHDLGLNYPSRAGTFYIINAGWTLSAAVNTVLMWAQSETQQKAQVFDSTVFSGLLDA